MAVYSYSGLDSNRASIKGTILAESPRHARDQLRKQGVVIESIAEQRRRTSNVSNSFPSANAGARRQWGNGAHELSMLLSAGVTLTEALETVAEQQKGAFRHALMRLKESVEAGSSLASAMSEQPEVFDAASIRLVEVGENAGTLEFVLAEIAEFKLQLANFKNRVATALVYPMFLSCFGTLAMLFLMTWVMPPLLESLEETLVELPWPTRIAKALSDFLISYGLWLLLGCFLVVVAIIIWTRTAYGRNWLDRFVLRVPVLGQLVLKQSLARASMIVALLTRGGVVLTTAMNLAARSTGNSVIREAFLQAEKDITAGEDMATSLRRSNCLPALAIRFFSVGQDSGKLDEMLERLSHDYNRQVATATARITALIEPVLILVLAAAVGFLLLATILPILEAGNVS